MWLRWDRDTVVLKQNRKLGNEVGGGVVNFDISIQLLIR